jgi:hypothetical protein
MTKLMKNMCPTNALKMHPKRFPNFLKNSAKKLVKEGRRELPASTTIQMWHRE